MTFKFQIDDSVLITNLNRLSDGSMGPGLNDDIEKIFTLAQVQYPKLFTIQTQFCHELRGNCYKLHQARRFWWAEEWLEEWLEG